MAMAMAMGMAMAMAIVIVMAMAMVLAIVIVNATRIRLGLSCAMDQRHALGVIFRASWANWVTPLAAGFLEQASGDAFPFDCGRSKRIIRTLICWASPLPPPSLELPSRPSLHACGRAKRV